MKVIAHGNNGELCVLIKVDEINDVLGKVYGYSGREDTRLSKEKGLRVGDEVNLRDGPNFLAAMQVLVEGFEDKYKAYERNAKTVLAFAKRLNEVPE